jgi:hypothetical protein
MITGKELKRYLTLIPDDAVVMLDGNPEADIIGIKVETDSVNGGWTVNLQITEGYSVTKDSVVKGIFDCLKLAK